MVADFWKKVNKDFFNKDLLYKIIGFLFIVIIIILIVSDVKIYQKKQQLDVQISQYEKQIADIQKSSQNLKEEIANADNIDYLEKIGYEQFNETKPGETEYMFVGQHDKKQEVAAKPQSFWQRLSLWFFKVVDWIKSKI